MIILDFSQILMANVYADMDANSCAKNPSDDSKNMLIHFALNSLRSNYNAYKTNYGPNMIVACDSRSWRYDVFPNYKYARKQKRLNDTSGIDWGFVNKVSDELYTIIDTYFPFPLLKVPGAEADDIIGVMTKYITQTDVNASENIFGDPEPQKILIMSSDRDNFQLHSFKNVRQFSIVEKKMIKPEGKARNALIEKIVKGDSGDGIPNIRSDANVFVNKIRQKPISSVYLNEFFTATNPIDVCTSQEEKDNYLRNETLVSYEKTPDLIREQIIAQYQKNMTKKCDKMALMNFLIKNRMKSLLSNIQDFF